MSGSHSLFPAMPTLAQFIPSWPYILLCAVAYALVQAARPFLSLYMHARRANRIGLPVKLLPVPQGLFSFFAFQLARQLPQEIRLPFSSTVLEVPGVKRLHAILNMGRPDGYGLHAELGDVFLTVNPAGINLVVADPNVAAYVNGRRTDFPKPPNTGAIINLYGRNVINAEKNDVHGDVWRLHRRVTGSVFSERIHADVWAEAHVQAGFMLDAWQRASSATSGDETFVVPDLGADTLRLGMNVITGAAYGQKLAWTSSTESPAAAPEKYSSSSSSRPQNPPTTTPTRLSYRESLEELTHHLFPLFLTPHWALRLAPRDSSWGRAWEAYEAFGGYMRGMLDAQASKTRTSTLEDKDDENLLAALLKAREEGPEGARPMTDEEVMGNAFIFLFAGHETTANTLHYALLRLALHPEIQDMLLEEIDAIYAQAEDADDLEYSVYERAPWARAVMNETLRVHTPTGITNKYVPKDSTIPYRGQQYVIPAGTRIAVNGTGVHFHPEVWGPDQLAWRPERWISYDETAFPSSPSAETPSHWQTTFPSSPSRKLTDDLYPTPPPTPGMIVSGRRSPSRQGTHDGTLLPAFTHSRADSPAQSMFASASASQYLLTPSASLNASFLSASVGSMPSRPSSPSPLRHASPPPSPSTAKATLAKPRRGVFLPFSEGNRACSGKKFAAVEFVRVLLTLLRDWRIEILSEEDGWSAERVVKVLGGRKAGALTLQPPEPVPVRFVRRRHPPATVST